MIITLCIHVNKSTSDDNIRFDAIVLFHPTWINEFHRSKMNEAFNQVNDNINCDLYQIK